MSMCERPHRLRVSFATETVPADFQGVKALEHKKGQER